MNPTRRDLMAGIGVTAIGATGILGWQTAPRAAYTLLLHTAGFGLGSAESRDVRGSLRGPVVQLEIPAFNRSFFAATASVLKCAPGTLIVALAHDAEALVLEHMLVQQGATALVRTRLGAAAMITATL